MAIRVGEGDDVVVGTSRYRLTLDDTRALIYFGPERVNTYLFVLLEEPKGETA